MDYTEQWLAKRDDSTNADIIVPATNNKLTDQPSATCSRATASSAYSASKLKQRQRPRKKASAATRFTGPMHIRLAEEDAPTSQSESDTSEYDSFNEEETGLFMISFYPYIKTHTHTLNIDGRECMICLFTSTSMAIQCFSCACFTITVIPFKQNKACLYMNHSIVIGMNFNMNSLISHNTHWN